MTATVGPRSRLPWISGAYLNHSAANIAPWETGRARPLDVLCVFPDRTSAAAFVDTWWLPSATPVTGNGGQVAIGVPLWTADQTVSTSNTSFFNVVSSMLVNNGLASKAIIRLGWEMNLPGWYWACTTANRTQWVANFKAAVNNLRANAPGVKIAFNVNEGPTQTGVDMGQLATDLLAYYDYVGIDFYNWYSAMNTQAQWDTRYAASYGMKYWETFATTNGKGFIVPEWGGAPLTESSDGVVYGQNMIARFAALANAGTSVIEAYFNEPAMSNTLWAPTTMTALATAYKNALAAQPTISATATTVNAADTASGAGQTANVTVVFNGTPTAKAGADTATIADAAASTVPNTGTAAAGTERAAAGDAAAVSVLSITPAPGPPPVTVDPTAVKPPTAPIVSGGASGYFGGGGAGPATGYGGGTYGGGRYGGRGTTVVAQQLVIADWSGGPSYELDGAANRHLHVSLLDQSEISFDMLGQHPNALLLHEGISDVWWVRAGRPLVRGRLTKATDALSVSGHSISCAVTDYRGMLDRRLIYADNTVTTGQKIYNSWYAKDIAWDIINTTQTRLGGDLGITKGGGWSTAGDLVWPSLPLSEGMTCWAGLKTVMAGTTELDGENHIFPVPGFEFDIDPDRKANVYYPNRSFVPKGVVLDFGGAVTQMSRTVDMSTYANAIRQSGNQPSDTKTRVADDIASRREGRWEQAFPDTQLMLPGQVEAMADYNFGNASTIVPQYSLTLAPNFWGGPDHIWVGDLVTVSVNSGRLRVADTQRVMNLDVKLDQNNNEEVTVTVGQPLKNRFVQMAKALQGLSIR